MSTCRRSISRSVVSKFKFASFGPRGTLNIAITSLELSTLTPKRIGRSEFSHYHLSLSFIMTTVALSGCTTGLYWCYKCTVLNPGVEVAGGGGGGGLDSSISSLSSISMSCTPCCHSW